MHKSRFGLSRLALVLSARRRKSWIIKYVSSVKEREAERGHGEKAAPLFNDRVTIERRPFGNLCHQPRALGKSIPLRGTAQDGW